MVRISKIEIAGSTRMKRNSRVEKRPSVPRKTTQSQIDPLYRPHDAGRKSRCRLTTMMMKRSSHMPTETNIEMKKSQAGEVRNLLNQSICGTTALHRSSTYQW